MAELRTSGNIGKRTEYRHQLERKLTPYDQPIRYAHDVLLWMRPIDFCVFFVLVSLMLWSILWVYSRTSVLTTFFFFVALFFIARRPLSVFQIPWDSILGPAELPCQAFSETVDMLISGQFLMREYKERLQSFHLVHPLQFYVQASLVSLLLAAVFYVISGRTVLILGVLAAFSVPGILYNGIPSRLNQHFRPHIQKLVEMASQKYHGAVQQYVHRRQQDSELAETDKNK